jgi:hypothetical protein
MVGYALAAQYQERVSRFIIMDAPLPGVGAWDEFSPDSKSFGGVSREHFGALYTQPGGS